VWSSELQVWKGVKRGTGEKVFFCGLCNRMSKRAEHAKTHFYKHSGVKPYVCDICDKSYQEPSGLRKHKLYQHQLSSSKY
jgi:uncharacterized Zn-finger protein